MLVKMIRKKVPQDRDLQGLPPDHAHHHPHPAPAHAVGLALTRDLVVGAAAVLGPGNR